MLPVYFKQVPRYRSNFAPNIPVKYVNIGSKGLPILNIYDFEKTQRDPG